MKNLTTKILAALIAVAMVFTLVACSESSSDGVDLDALANPEANDGVDDNDADNSNDDADANSGGGLGLGNGRGGGPNSNTNNNDDDSSNDDSTTDDDTANDNNDDDDSPNVDADGRPIINTLGGFGVTQYELSGQIPDPWSNDPNNMTNLILGAYLAEIVDYCDVTGQPVWGKATFQSFGLPGLDDGKHLLSLGYPVIATRDRNGHGDTSRVVNGEPFSGKREIISGYAVFTVTTILHGGVQVHYNIALYAPEGAVIDGAPGTWNLREKHLLPNNHPFTRHTALEFAELEARWGATDPAMFVGYQASKGEVINLMQLHEQFLAAGDYMSYNPNLSNWG